jgi:hypothetical protein
MCILGPVTAAHGHNKTNDLATAFQPGISQCGGDYVRKQRVGCQHDVRTRNQNAHYRTTPRKEKSAERLKILLPQRREAGERRSRVTIERRRDAPDTAVAVPQLSLL